ncbi:hypothetical protein D3C85_1303570 [compost metagenome]
MDVHAEVDGAHDAVAKFLMDEFFDGGAVDIDQFVPAVDQRICRYGSGQRSFVGHDLQPRYRFIREAQDFADGFSLSFIESHLTQASCCSPFFGHAHGLGNLTPLEAFTNFRRNNQFRDFFARCDHQDFLWISGFSQPARC